mgnify:CR=1 FL=1
MQHVHHEVRVGRLDFSVSTHEIIGQTDSAPRQLNIEAVTSKTRVVAAGIAALLIGLTPVAFIAAVPLLTGLGYVVFLTPAVALFALLVTGVTWRTRNELRNRLALDLAIASDGSLIAATCETVGAGRLETDAGIDLLGLVQSQPEASLQWRKATSIFGASLVPVLAIGDHSAALARPSWRRQHPRRWDAVFQWNAERSMS